MNKSAEEPRSLLHRLLKKAADVENAPTQANTLSSTDGSPSATIANSNTVDAPVNSGVAKRATSGESSPVRPVDPQKSATEVPTPIAPSMAALVEDPPLTIPTHIGGVEERLQAEAALEALRQKTAITASEFAEGKLNRAQFAAIYARYNELRVIIERLLANDPTTQAWQRVVRPGHTGFLRQHFEAQALAFAIYDYNNDEPIINYSSLAVPATILTQILSALRVYVRSKGVPGPLGKALDNGRWIAITPGSFTVTIVAFSLEPSARQTRLVQDLHRDFERANHIALERGIRTPDQLVYPHRALVKTVSNP